MITAVNQTLAETLATIAKFATDNGARLESVTVGDVSFTLRPAEPAVVEVTATKADEPAPSALNDPATYGWTNGTPGFRDPRRKADQ